MIVLCTGTTLVFDLPLQCSVDSHCIMGEDCMNVHLKHKLSVSACFRLRRTLLPSKLPNYSIQTLLRKQCAIALSQFASLSSALLYLDLLSVNGRISSPAISHHNCHTARETAAFSARRTNGSTLQNHRTVQSHGLSEHSDVRVKMSLCGGKRCGELHA